jgi:hypothetical protein
LSFMSYHLALPGAPVFFTASAFVFLMLLPSCSREDEDKERKDREDELDQAYADDQVNPYE